MANLNEQGVLAQGQPVNNLVDQLRLVAAWHTPGGATPEQSCPAKAPVCLAAALEIERLNEVVRAFGDTMQRAGTAAGLLAGSDINSTLVPAIQILSKDAERLAWLLDGNGYFLEEAMMCGHKVDDPFEQSIESKQARDAIDAQIEATGWRP